MTYYDRILATNLSECADRNLKLWPEHQEIMMIIKWQCNSESDLSQPEGAHEECKAGVSYLVLLCTFFFFIIQFIAATVVCPGLLLLQECAAAMHCRCAGDDSGCHFRLRKFQQSCIRCHKGWNFAVLWLLFLIMTQLFHLLLKLVPLWQNNKLWFGQTFIEKKRPKTSTITQD